MLLAVWHFIVPILQIIFLFVSWILVSKLQAINCLVWEVVGLPFTHLYAPNVPKGIDGPSNVLPYRFSNGVLPSAILSCTLRK